MHGCILCSLFYSAKASLSGVCLSFSPVTKKRLYRPKTRTVNLLKVLTRVNFKRAHHEGVEMHSTLGTSCRGHPECSVIPIPVLELTSIKRNHSEMAEDMVHPKLLALHTLFA
jgi:hypothetical protein